MLQTACSCQLRHAAALRSLPCLCSLCWEPAGICAHVVYKAVKTSPAMLLSIKLLSLHRVVVCALQASN